MINGVEEVLILLYRVSVRALVLKYRRTRLNSEVYYSRNILIVEKTHDSKRQKEGEKYLASFNNSISGFKGVKAI
jgi:hypothetical protein